MELYINLQCRELYVCLLIVYMIIKSKKGFFTKDFKFFLILEELLIDNKRIINL